MLSGMLKMIGILFAKIGYGKQADEHNCIFIGSIFSLMIIFWFLCFSFLVTGSAAKDTALCIVYCIIVPIIMVAWFIYARLFSEDKPNLVDITPDGYWSCPECHLYNQGGTVCDRCGYKPTFANMIHETDDK